MTASYVVSRSARRTFRTVSGSLVVALVALGIGITLQGNADAAVPAPIGPSGSWTSTFSDDFNGTALDTTKWRPNRSGGNNVDGPFNPSSEGATFAPANVTVADGNLVFTIKAAPTRVGGKAYPLTSGTVSSDGRYALRDGEYVEARILIPQGDGLWPAFWAMTPNSWPPEIDGFEFFNTASQSAPRFNYHPIGGGQSGPKAYGAPGVDYRGGWHTYGWLRKSGVLTPFVDGVAYPQAGASGVDNGVYFIVLNLSVYQGHSPTAGAGATQMKIDWVRAWKPGAPPVLAPPVVTPTVVTPPPTPITPVAPAHLVSVVGSSAAQSPDRVSGMTLTKPAATKPGDVLIVALTVDHTPTVALPAGWKALAPAQRLGSGATVLSYYRISAAGDPASWTWPLSSTEKWGGGMTAFTGVDQILPLGTTPTAATDTTYTAKSVSAPSLTTTFTNELLITGYGSDSRLPAPPAGFTGQWASTSGQVSMLAVAQPPGTGATGKQTWTVSTALAIGTWMVTLRSA